MNNRLILEGEYLEIIVELLSCRYKVDSLIKLVFMAYCIKNAKARSYARRNKDFIDVFFSSLNLKLLSHPNELNAILEVIYKLKTSGWIRVIDDKIFVLKNLDDFECENAFLLNCRAKDINPIIEVNKLDGKSFAEEVLRHV